MAVSNSTYISEITSDQWDGQLVVAFGDARVDNAIPSEMVWRVENPAGLRSTELQHCPRPDLMLGGIAFVLPDSLTAQDAAVVVEIQKLFIYLHYKFVFFPRRSPSSADVLGVRNEPLPDVMREINQLRNYPWLLGSPLSDKLADERIGLPVFILLPGPSSHEVYPRLKEIRKHCLIACLARTIHHCLDADVVPDIVIQLDTYQVQRNFYYNLPDMPETLLVPLSICPFHSYAGKFRGLVMMDSFNLDLLPNPARLRESYVSSLTACLGLAEILHSPQAILAGANLSDSSGQPKHPYAGRSQGAQPVFILKGKHYVEARDGTPVGSREDFIPTAKEADLFAEAIAQSTGTRFYSTTDTTLLSRHWFPHMTLETIFQLPVIDRNAYLEIVDRALDVREEIDLIKTRMGLLEQLQQLIEVERIYLDGHATRDILESHQLTKAARRMRNPIIPQGVDHVGVAARLATMWRRALNDTRLLVLGVANARRGKSVPMLCFSDEIEPLTTAMGRIIPKTQWKFVSIATRPYPRFKKGAVFKPNTVLSWMSTEQVVFASPRMMKEFDYIFSCAPEDNVYDLRQLVGDKG